MQDMIGVLSTLRHAGAPHRAEADVAAADVARGHDALIRRRRHRIVGSSAIVAAVTAVAVGSAGFGQAGRTVEATPGASTQQTAVVQLAAYTGIQPAGFRVRTVPAGWRVASSTQYAFVVAPPGADTSIGHSGAVNFRSGIAVMLEGQSRLPSDSPTTKVTVGGHEGTYGLTRDHQAEWLIFPDAAGDTVLVQVPTKLGLTTDQIVRFAEGITVTSQAHPAGG